MSQNNVVTESSQLLSTLIYIHQHLNLVQASPEEAKQPRNTCTPFPLPPALYTTVHTCEYTHTDMHKCRETDKSKINKINQTKGIFM